ncbi:hypothetical protein BDZ89DRAFT_1139424 [Hymenopellis radicata]|nr:hypothetical protein BDZ89DRAFT_1139424 [Hymenopellis radicata]
MKVELGFNENCAPKASLGIAALEFEHPSRAPRTCKSFDCAPGVLAAILTYTPTVDIRVRQYLRIVQFPEWLHRGIVAIQHAISYAMDTESIPLRSQIQLDFDALSNILGLYSHLQSSTTPSDATIVFIHFSALGKPSRLPLREMRKRRTPIFIGFGRTIPKNPKFAVLFRSGGLITFSPAVLCEEPLRILDIISKYKDYRWESKVVQAYTRGTFAFEWILDAIVAGDLEMTFGLLHRRAPVYTCDTDLILRRCLDDYAESKPWLEVAISKDMLLRQRSVGISAQFRRYVILDIEQATRAEDEFEWLSCKEFVDSLGMGM